MMCLIPDWVPRQFGGLDGVGTGRFKSYILPINPAHSLLCFANCPMPASALNIQIWYNWLSSSILVNTLVNMRSVLKQAGIYKVTRYIYLSDVKYHYDRPVASANHLQLHHLYQPGAGTGTKHCIGHSVCPSHLIKLCEYKTNPYMLSYWTFP